MKHLIITLIILSVLGCVQPEDEEQDKYSSYSWEYNFFKDNIGISLLCTNKEDRVSFLLIAAEDDWIDNSDYEVGSFRADYAYIIYRYNKKGGADAKAFEVKKARDVHSYFEINPKEMKGFMSYYVNYVGRVSRRIKLDRESLKLHEQLRYGGDGDSYWSFMAECKVSNNTEIVSALENLENNARNAKKKSLEKIKLEKEEQKNLNKI